MLYITEVYENSLNKTGKSKCVRLAGDVSTKYKNKTTHIFHTSLLSLEAK